MFCFFSIVRKDQRDTTLVPVTKHKKVLSYYQWLYYSHWSSYSHIAFSSAHVRGEYEGCKTLSIDHCFLLKLSFFSFFFHLVISNYSQFYPTVFCPVCFGVIRIFRLCFTIPFCSKPIFANTF